MTNNKKIFLLSLTVVLGVLVLCLGIIIYRPSQTVIEQPQKAQSNTGQTVVVDSTYFRTILLPGYSIKKQQNLTNGNDLYSAIILKDHPSTDQLAIFIGNLPTGGVTQIASYVFRAKTPERYEKTHLTDLPENAEAFSLISQDNYELTVFWPNGDKYASISATGTKASASLLNNLITNTINNWEWKR